MIPSSFLYLELLFMHVMINRNITILIGSVYILRSKYELVYEFYFCIIDKRMKY